MTQLLLVVALVLTLFDVYVIVSHFTT